MNYSKIYNDIVQHRKNSIVEGYAENHHITPRSLGGLDDKDNLVRLTAREHFICHLLLVKIYENTDHYYKMVKAFHMMFFCKSNGQQRYVSSRKYESLKKLFSIAKSIEQSGEGNSQFGTTWVHHELFGAKRVPYKLIEEYIFQGWIKSKKTKLARGPRKVKIIPKNEIDKLSNWYEIYKDHGFEEFCKTTGYDKSKQNLVQIFKKRVNAFVPQNGKKRGKSFEV